MIKLHELIKYLEQNNDFSNQQWEELSKKSNIQLSDIDKLLIKSIELNRVSVFKKLVDNFNIDTKEYINFNNFPDTRLFQCAFIIMIKKDILNFEIMDFLIERDNSILKEFYSFLGNSKLQFNLLGIAAVMNDDVAKMKSIIKYLTSKKICLSYPVALSKDNIRIGIMELAILIDVEPEFIEALAEFVGFPDAILSGKDYIEFLTSPPYDKKYFEDYIRIFIREKIKLSLGIEVMNKFYDHSIDQIVIALHSGKIKENYGRSQKIVQLFSDLKNELQGLEMLSDEAQFNQAKQSIFQVIQKLRGFGLSVSEIEKTAEKLEFKDFSRFYKITKFCFRFFGFICMFASAFNYLKSSPDAIKNFIQSFKKFSEFKDISAEASIIASGISGLSFLLLSILIDDSKPILPKEFKYEFAKSFVAKDPSKLRQF